MSACSPFRLVPAHLFACSLMTSLLLLVAVQGLTQDQAKKFVEKAIDNQ
jgi:hypothetical protein